MIMVKTCQIYQTKDGKTPYEDWLNGLKDVVGRAKIRVRVDRATLGNFGDHRSVGAGITELKIDFGPGYRVYLGQHGTDIIVLLCGGDKSTQEKDIAKAHQYWEDYRRRV